MAPELPARCLTPVSRRTLVAAGCLAVLSLAATPTTAAAHPFGPPPTAQVAADGRLITIDWSATADDAVAIGERLGVMPPGSVERYRQESAAQAAPSAEDEARLSASPALRDYLLEHIAATQYGRPCQGTVRRISDFVHSGARVVLTCPEPVTEVELRISMLHDIHDAYRTFAVGTMTQPPESVFTLDTPRQTWRFGVTGGDRFAVSPAVVVGVVALCVAAVAGALHWRQSRLRG